MILMEYQISQRKLLIKCIDRRFLWKIRRSALGCRIACVSVESLRKERIKGEHA